MSTTRSTKQDRVQDLKSGTVQRLSQHFLQASKSQPPKPPPPTRCQPLTIPKTFKLDSTTSSESQSPLSPISQGYGRKDPLVAHPRQHSAPQLLLRPASPNINNSNNSFSHLSQVAFVQSRDVAGGMSASSMGSNDSFVSALSHIDSPKEPGSPRAVPLWKQILDAIEQEDRPELDRVLNAFDFSMVVQTLVTWNISNTDNQYRHDPDVLLDAKELLGPTVDHLNLIQIACFLFNEEMALDLLNFIATASEELESKKILYEFMGKLWGDGNTTLHLASFLGMADLTKRLLDLGANVYKMNDRKYKPVDCADENTTRTLFLNLTEVVRYRRIGHDSLPTSPLSESGSDFNWSSFRSLGHLRSPSTSTLPLSLMSSGENLLKKDDGDTIITLSAQRPASHLGLAGSLRGLLISGPRSTELQSKLESTPEPSGDNSQGDSSLCIEDLSLTEPRANSGTDLQDGFVLSPIVVSKSTATAAGANSVLATPSTSTLSPPKEPAFHSLESRLPLDHAHSTLSNSSHIRPKLRSYQSSPSIRLHASTVDSSRTPSISKAKSKGRKRVSFDPQSLMADASRTGDLELLKSMVAYVEEEGKMGTVAEIVNYQSASRRLSALHLAASYNHLALCQYLVEMGASVNLTDMEGWTPMHCAAAEGHLAVFEFLVKEPDADLQATTFDGELIEDVVEDEDLRQRVTDIIEMQSRG